MLKYFIFILTVALSACTLWLQKKNVTDSTVDTHEHHDWVVGNILWHMHGDIEIETAFSPLIDIQHGCKDRDFIEYRECFIEKLESISGEIVNTSEKQRNINILLWSLRDEIRYFPYYQKIDRFSYPDKDILLWDDKDCYIVATGAHLSEYMWQLAEYESPVILSYSSRYRDILLGTFPIWIWGTRYPAENFTGAWLDGDNPCLYRTWWPTLGNIVHVVESWDDIYLFMKDGDGAGSWEFSYSIIVYNKKTQNSINIGSMWVWSWIFPFEYNFNWEKSPKTIEEMHKNMPFLYRTYFNTLWTHGDTVESVFRESIQ